MNLPDRFETERLLIQRLKYEDAEEIFYAYASKAEATLHVSWPTHQQISDTKEYIAFAIQSWEVGLDFTFSLRRKEDHRLIGSIGAVNDNGKLQFGYIINPQWWNHGFATEACKALIIQLIKIKTVFRIWTFVDAENLSSIAVLKKCGMIEEARLPLWYRFINQGDKPKDCILFRYPF